MIRYDFCNFLNYFIEPNDTFRQILKLPSSENVGNVSNTTKSQTLAERWNESIRKDNATLNLEPRDDSAIPISQESCITQKIFQGIFLLFYVNLTIIAYNLTLFRLINFIGLVFIVNGFDKDDYSQLITQIHGLGGKLVSKNYAGIPDYGIVPQFNAELKHTVGEIVTDLFIVSVQYEILFSF